MAFLRWPVGWLGTPNTVSVKVRARKPTGIPAHLTNSLADNSRVVIKALGEGELTPDEAVSVLQALASQVRIIEADEIEKRLAALSCAEAIVSF